PVAIESVGDAGGVQQQILNRHGATQRHEIKYRLAQLVLALYADLHAGEGRNVFADGIVELDGSAIDQHQLGKAGNGLGQRVHRKNRIRRHVDSGIGIALAKPLEIDRPAVALDQDDGARNFSLCDLVVEEFVDPRKLLQRQRRIRRRAKGGRGELAWRKNKDRDKQSNV